MKERRPPRQFLAHPFAYHQELEVTIESLTNLGAGVARVDGWVIFVAYALPGERILCRVYRNHKNYSEADLVQVLEPSEHRVQSRCALFGECGGCQYQHLDYAEQLRWKQRQVAELLQKMAGIDFAVEAVHPSPVTYAYRSKITPHYQRPRQGQVGDIGFLRAGSRQALVDVEKCEIAMQELNAELGRVREWAKAEGGERKKGATLLMRVAQGRVLRKADDLAIEIVLGKRYEFKAGDFFQNNPFILPEFVSYVIDQARQSGADYLVDAYCGSGLFAIAAADSFAEVWGVEVSASAVAQATHNAAINGLTQCHFLAAEAEQIFAELPCQGAQTVVLIDPPRAGCSEGFVQQLLAYAPRMLVYVSCNPATQMRDLNLLREGGYQLEKVKPFDLFPQTRHLECVMTLTRTSA